MFLIVRPLLARVAARITRRETLTQNVVAVTLLLLFASSWITELIGIHALFGAFLFGAILPKEGGFATALTDKLEELVLVVLLPLFFAYSGIRTQIGLLDSAWAWGVCGLIIAVACIGKFGASSVVARLTGLSWRESSALGVLMNTRGLMELIVLNIGLDLGVIGPTLFTMMVVMALVTTVLTTPLLNLIYPPDLLTRELAKPTPADEALMPRAYTTLMCVADDRIGPSLVTLAAALRPHRGEARLYALRLVNPSERATFSERETEELAKATLSPLLARANVLDIDVKPLSFVSADPAADICNVANVKEADLILMGSHRPVLGQTLLGGTVYRVMRETNANVGVLIDHGLNRIRRILVPFLGTPHDRAALQLAQQIMQRTRAEVTILHVVKPGRAPSDTRLSAQETVSNTFEESEGGRVIFKVMETDSPTDAALAECTSGYDIVVIGLGRDWGLEQRQFRIQRERLLTECATSLLVVRQGEAVAEAVLTDGASAETASDALPAGRAIG
jgi:nucleotide-binding universal stress UspA family protein